MSRETALIARAAATVPDFWSLAPRYGIPAVLDAYWTPDGDWVVVDGASLREIERATGRGNVTYLEIEHIVSTLRKRYRRTRGTSV